MITLGGFNKNYKYLKKNYFHVDTIAVNGKNLSLILLKMVIIKMKKAYEVINQLYGFFFEVSKNDLRNNIFAIKYIGRYLSRAPIAEYKILDFFDNKVTFYYEDLSNNKEKVEVTMKVEEFLSKLIVHIPPKNFKLIKRFGIYSRNIKKELTFIIFKIKKYKSQYTKITFYQLEIW